MLMLFSITIATIGSRWARRKSRRQAVETAS